jgi:nitrite reductase/ring-hydroxylating ferredoxin subunit
LADDQRLIVCPSAALVDGGDGVRFEVRRGGRAQAAFAIRTAGRVRAYLNRCAHVPVELDWQPGRFFDADGIVLICSTHGAIYDPANGGCLGGPCGGRGLEEVGVAEIDGQVVLRE